MKKIEISDELYVRLRNCVIDPFDDTPESVIIRLIDIVDKAKSRLSPWDQRQLVSEQQEKTQNTDQTEEPTQQGSWQKPVEVAL